MPPPGPAYKQIRYAIMLTTDGSATDADVGLYDGSFCWISDQLINGNVAGSGIPINPVTTLAQTIWKPGIFIKEQLGNPSLSVNLQSLGSYGEVSSHTIRIKNTALFSEYLRTQFNNAIYKRVVKFFVVTDDTDDSGGAVTFTLFWTGVVGSISYDELILSISCTDVLKDIHKPFPPRKYDNVSFPLIQEDVIDKAGVVSIGKVTNARLIGIEGGIVILPAYRTSGVDYFSTVVSKMITNRNFFIKTGDVIFQPNELVNCFLRCIEQGPNDTRKIYSNLLSSGGITSVSIGEPFLVNNLAVAPEALFYLGTSNLTNDRITFDAEIIQQNFVNGEPIKFTVAPGGANLVSTYYIRNKTATYFQIGLAPTGALVNLTTSVPVTWFKVNNQAWWFELIRPGTSRALSENPIYSFERDLNNNTPIIKRWDDNFKRFTNAYGSIRSLYKDGLPGYFPMAGVDLILTSPDDGGKINVSWGGISKPKKVYIKEISVKNIFGTQVGTSVLSNTFPAINSDCPNLRDQNGSTGYSATFRSDAGNPGQGEIVPTFVFDLEINKDDLLETITQLSVAYKAVFTIINTGDSKAIEYIPILSIVDIFDSEGVQLNPKTGIAIPNLNVNGSVSVASPHTVLTFLETLYFGTPFDPLTNYGGGMWCEFPVSDVKILSKIKSIRFKIIFIIGETGASGTDKTYDLTIDFKELIAGKTLKTQAKTEDIYLKIQGEKFADTWGGRRAAGNPVVHLVDAIEFIMRQYDNAGSFVDTATFDSAKALMSVDVQVGRQVDERKDSSIEYLEELCVHGMLAITPLHNGKRALRNWVLDNGSGGFTFDESIIIPESLSVMQDTPLFKCYNEFSLNFDKNPATGKYLKSIFVKKIDENTFPASDLPVGPELTFNLASFGYTGYMLLSDGSDKRLAIIFGNVITPIVGQRFTLVGGFAGFSFTRKEVGINGVYPSTSGSYVILEFSVAVVGLVAGVLYQVGTMTYWDSKILAWTEFVGGISDFSFANALWSTCHNNWLITKTKKTLFLDLPWFPDLKTDWGDVDPDNNGPAYLIDKLAFWLSRPMKTVSCKVPITTATLALEVGTGQFFNDQKLTAGTTRYCWIENIRLNTKDDLLEMDLLVNPWIGIS